MMLGCSQFGQIDEVRQARWQSNQQALEAVQSWDIVGRAVIAMKGEAYSLGLQWRQQRGAMKMLLQAPFGQGVIQIDTNQAGQYQLRLPNGQIHISDSPEALLEEVVGWSIPISGLKFWIRGLPQPDGSFSHRLNQDGRPDSIRQNQWTIDYQDYFRKQQPVLPRRIKLTHANILLKLVIERWQQAEVSNQPNQLFPEFN